MHICNGGFLTLPEVQNRGIGKAMGKAFILLAPQLGYRAGALSSPFKCFTWAHSLYCYIAMFNLVFESNEPSVRLWRSLGFKQIGRIPEAGLLANGKYVDALMFHYDFVKESVRPA